ncbi:hypothetical protein [Saccharothrix coeruleofusca]|uniref:hypothetical protein n=1 Tax=Saccharothrix coeruleofusca TaxID=33919 RepID=UPI0016718146|nr:hypothetical protein [Saccharothrix coeruleofusca]
MIVVNCAVVLHRFTHSRFGIGERRLNCRPGAYFGRFGSTAVASLVTASQASSSEAFAEATTSILDEEVTSMAIAQDEEENVFLTNLALRAPTSASDASA